MFSFITPFLMKYWKNLALIGMVLVLLGGSYVKGRRDCSRAMAKEVAKELEKTHEAVETERDRTNTIRDIIRENRERNPLDDKRDSCLLSNDPYEVDCLKGDEK